MDKQQSRRKFSPEVRGGHWRASSGREVTVIHSSNIGAFDDVKNLSQIWAVAPVLVKLALQDDQPSQR
jgi:hypothetical protein